jgi:AcrR family transcriptional regulator
MRGGIAKLMTKRRDNDKAKAILDAAFECVYEDGIANLSMRSIAGKLGIHKSLIHYYFKDKESLIVELLRTVFGEVSTEWSKLATSPLPAEEKIKSIPDFIKGSIKKRRKVFVVFIECWSLGIRNQSMRKVFSQLYANNRQVIKQIIEDGKKERVLNDVDPEYVASSFMSFSMGLALQKFMTNEPVDMDAYMEAWGKRFSQLLIKKKFL